MSEPGNWEQTFRAVYDRAVEAFDRRGARTPDECIGENDRRFLATVGCSIQELYDFVEDGCYAGEPSFDEVLAVTRIRRDYFLAAQGGVPPKESRRASTFPSRSAALEGIAWLPRLIAKAEAKLRGELPPELMFGCGGDRPFLRSYGVSLADFLATIRDAKGDAKPVLALLKGKDRPS
jgi:hypothetical protein